MEISMKYKEKECLYCSRTFLALIKEIVRGNAKFCSRSCCSKHTQVSRKPKPNSVCAYCNKPIYRNPTRKRNSKSGLMFCCREHKDLAQRLEGGLEEMHLPHYTDGRHIKYKYLLGPLEDRKCNRCGYNKHPEIIIAHHIDRDRTNNKKENLEALCSRCHDEEHFLSGDGKWAR